MNRFPDLKEAIRFESTFVNRILLLFGLDDVLVIFSQLDWMHK